jgi:hypothetical protein
MIATKETKSHAQALLGMAKEEAKIADIVEAGARRPPPREDELRRSLPQKAVGRYTSDAPRPPKSLYDDDDEECSAGSSSVDDEFLSYLSGSGSTPPPIPPLPSVVTMVPASARSVNNRASVEASMMQVTAGLGDASRRTMLAADVPVDAAPADRAGVDSQAQALLDTAEDEAEIADAVDAGARRPSLRVDGLGRSLPQEAAGRRTSDDPPPSTPSATLPPKSRHPWNPAPSALAALHAQYADIPPLPSAPPLELLMEEGFFDGPTGEDRPTTDAPPTGDERHARMTPLAEAAVVLMPVCEAVPTVGPTPAQDEEDIAAQAGWTVKCGNYMMIGVASLIFLAVGTLIVAVVMIVGLSKQGDPVTTSTSSTTAVMTSITSAASSQPTESPTTSAPSSQPTEFPTSSSPSGKPTNSPTISPSIQPTEFPTTSSPSSKPTNSPIISPSSQPTEFPTSSSPSTSSMTTPEINTVSG